MIDQKIFERITRILPVLQRADSPLKRDFQQVAVFTRIPAGRDVFVEGDRADAIALLISGVVRVVLAAVFVLTSVIAFCPLYAPFKFSTYKG
ncbi:MAG: DUF2892 domain-containing protein [Chloroflexi bacterium]|nr:DUF2892 domain-containing protein [Chloroflexota bacterium]